MIKHVRYLLSNTEEIDVCIINCEIHTDKSSALGNPLTLFEFLNHCLCFIFQIMKSLGIASSTVQVNNFEKVSFVYYLSKN